MAARSGVWTSYAMAGWMLVFAGVHAYWAGGGAAGLPDGMRVTGRPLLLAIDLLAVPLCLLGAWVALALVRPVAAQDGRGWAGFVGWTGRRRLIGLTWGAAALAFVHSAPAIADDLLAAAGLLDLNVHDQSSRLVYFVFEPFWMLGAVLCALAALAATARGVAARLPVAAPTAPHGDGARELTGVAR